MFHFLRYNRSNNRIQKIASDHDLFGKNGLDKMVDFSELMFS